MELGQEGGQKHRIGESRKPRTVKNSERNGKLKGVAWGTKPTSDNSSRDELA